MAFCPQCGKSVKDIEKFCANCGENLKEFLEHIEEEAEEKVKKTSYKGLVLFILFLVIVGYIVLDIWAMTQLTPALSVSSIASSVLNFNGNYGLSETTLKTTLRVENPTFVPILFGRVSYDANHQGTKVAEGKTGFFIMSPHSKENMPVDLTIYPLTTGWEGIKSIWNKFTGTQDKWSANAYVDFGITKFKIASSG